ncbi:FAS1-like dehydratase domain-containing protein [Microbacterium sp. No. 7]|uniref:FAS1-like dehydratase domain-containing protein n=1 Tax=Microbacterium sp. No. 7 TaxID=1714373 RepID=UPI0006D19A5E|nr:MaoC family dehydratase N-terminal domain-containing protein [Microbacterium sp. No. 7]ALJ18882.1 acyl dehydratase [Microbacterium sp. No. 7]
MSNVTEATESTSTRFQEADIEQAQKLVGAYFPTQKHEHFRTATPDVIRNFATSYGDDNPLYTDDEYGVSTRWGSQIAPPLIGVAVNTALEGDRRPKELRRPAFRNIQVFVSGSSWEHHRPVLPGDRLFQFEGFEKVEVKESEFAGRSVIVTRRHVRMNQDADVVSVARMIAIHTERAGARDDSKRPAFEPARYSAADIDELDAAYAAERPRGAEPRYWEDVQVGDAIEPRVKGPLTTTDIVVFHAGGYGFTPYGLYTSRLAFANRRRIGPFYVPNEYGIPDVAQRVHWDADWARSVGTATSYDYGILRDTWLNHALTDWMGDDGWIVRFSSQMRKFNYLGDVHRITGEIVAKRVDDGGRHVVDVELRGTNQRGEVTCPATATIALPTRSGGQVVLPPVDQATADMAAEFMARHRELLAAQRG